MRSRTPIITAVAAALVLIPTVAHAAGSDAPTPYTVTSAGLQLPAGMTFEANGHLNYRVTQLDGTGPRTFNVHQSMPHNGVWPQARYVGRDYYAWTDHPDFAAAFPGDYCITWVQVSLTNEHFGEGGQAPVCSVDAKEPTVDPTEPTVDPTEPTVDPTEPTVKPTEPTVDPTEPAVEPSEPSEPSTDPTQPTVEPTGPSAPTVTSGTGGAQADSTPPHVRETADAGVADTSADAAALGSSARELAQTGAPIGLLSGVVAVVVAAGTGLLVWSRRARPASSQY